MTDIEIKKELYRQKPRAILGLIRNGVAYYHADLEQQRVFFEIHFNEMGITDFTPNMDAKLLGRWIINEPAK
jgi:hypothetical protein